MFSNNSGNAESQRHQLQTLTTNHKDDISRVAFNHDGTQLYAGSEDGTLMVYDLDSTGRFTQTHHLRGHKQDVWAIAARSNGTFFSGSSDGHLSLWDGKNGEPIAATAGHRQTVKEVFLLANDSLMLTVGQDGSALFWDRESGTVLDRFDSFSDRLTHVRHFNIDERHFLLAAAGGSKLHMLSWTIKGNRPHDIRRHTESLDLGKRIANLTISREGKTIAAVTVGGSRVFQYAYLWEGKIGNTPENPIKFKSRGRIPPEDSLSIALNTNGELFASGTAKGAITLRFLAEDKEPVNWEAHKRAITALAFKPAPDGAASDPYLVSGSADSELRGWYTNDIDLASGDSLVSRSLVEFYISRRRLERISKGNSLGSTIAAMLLETDFPGKVFSSEMMFRGGLAEALRGQLGDNMSEYQEYVSDLVKSIETRSRAVETKSLGPVVMRGHKDQITRIAFYKDGQYMASGSSDRSIRIWEVESGSELEALHGHDGDISSLAISGDLSNYVLLSGSTDKSAMLWDIQAGIDRNQILVVRDTVRSLSFNTPGNRLAATDQSGNLTLWDIDRSGYHDYRAENPVRISTGKSVLLSATFHPVNHAELAVGSKVDFMRTVNSKNRKLAILPGQRGDGMQVSYSANGTYVANGSSDGYIRIWNTTSGELVAEHQAHAEKVRSVVFHPHVETLLASAGSDQRVYLWKLGKPETSSRTARKLTLSADAGPYNNFNDGVWSIAFSPGGNQLACASWDGVIRIWNHNTGQEVALFGHRGPVLSVDYAADGNWLASGSWDGTVRIWDMRTCKEIAMFDAHQGPVRAVQFHPEGKLLASGGSDGTIRLRDVNDLRMSEISAEIFAASGKTVTIADSSSEKVKLRNDPLESDLALLAGEAFKSSYIEKLPFKAWQALWEKRLSLYYDERQQKLFEQPHHFYLMPGAKEQKPAPIHRARQRDVGALSFLDGQTNGYPAKQTWSFLGYFPVGGQ